jgi:hypothetical protein
MTIWVLHCWAQDMLEVEVVGSYPTLEGALSWAAAYIEGERAAGVVGRYRGTFSVCEASATPQATPTT